MRKGWNISIYRSPINCRIKALIILYRQELETGNWLKGLDRVVLLVYFRWEAMFLSQIYLQMDLPPLIT